VSGPVRLIRGLVDGAGAVLLAAIVLVVLTQVVTRYLLQVSISWPEELARYLLVWLMFLGGAAAGARLQQINVDMLMSIAPRRIQAVLEVVATLGSLLAIGILVWAGRPLFGPAGLTVSPATGIAMRWIYVAMPVGGVLLGLFVLRDVGRVLSRRSSARPDPGGHERG
jgi:TRAP-type C4-dicarboxylate transport system permease small subunit